MSERQSKRGAESPLAATPKRTRAEAGEGIFVLPGIPIDHNQQREDILTEVKRRVDSLTPDDITCEEVEPGKLRIMNTPASMLLSTMNKRLDQLQGELEKEKRERKDDIEALRTEMRPFQNTIILIRKGIFENILRKKNLHDQNTIDDRNLAAHGGDILMDANVVEEVGNTSGTSRETELYQQTFKELYGIRLRDLPFMAKYKDMVKILDIRATVKLADRRFNSVAIPEAQRLVDEAVAIFNNLEEVNIEKDLAQGRLGNLVRDIESRYREEWRSTPVQN